MKHGWVTRRAGLIGLLAVSLLLVGGLGWATRAALRLEEERLLAQARAELFDRLRLALWRLDSRMTAFVAREEARPFNHYSAIFAPTLALDSRGRGLPPGAVIEPSPLLGAELPEWAMLHFQGDGQALESPQVLGPELARRLRGMGPALSTRNVTPERVCLLRKLREELLAPRLLAEARQHARQATIRDRALVAGDRPPFEGPLQQQGLGPSEGVKDFLTRKGEQSKLATGGRASQVRIDRDVALGNLARNGAEWLSSLAPTNGELKKTTGTRGEKDLPAPSAEVVVSMSPMIGLWVEGKAGNRLVMLRLVRLGEREAVQGILLDASRLADLLADEVQDLFPHARLVPESSTTSDVALTMSAVPFRLAPGERPVAVSPGWSALRIGLALAWGALGLALGVGTLGAWSLLDLSERRFRFVSAVTHELRTPLTTLRLYLDLMLRGVIVEGPARAEYLATMSVETDRLAQLVNNVLAYSRLEGQKGAVTLAEVPLSSLLDETAAAWTGRCEAAGLQLVVETTGSEGERLRTDAGLVAQVLGNLLENACKYSRDAADRRVWLRARHAGGQVVIEVEDHGPGIPPAERERIFRPFQRGQDAAPTGGVGLGLALSRQWAELLGGRLTLHAPTEGGACFRLELPA